MTDFGPEITRDDFNRADNPLRASPDFSWERIAGEALVWRVPIADDAYVVIQGGKLVIKPEA